MQPPPGTAPSPEMVSAQCVGRRLSGGRGPVRSGVPARISGRALASAHRTVGPDLLFRLRRVRLAPQPGL